MAIEEADDEGAETPAVPKKAGSKVLIIAIIAVLLVALLGVGGYIIMTQMGGDKAAPAADGTATEDAAPKKENSMGEMMGLDAFIVNLSGEAGKRYLKITMQLELNSGNMVEELSNKMPQIKDSVITVLSSKTTEDLLTIEGKFKLKEQLLTRINSLLRTGVVKNVYFVEFVIQ